MLVLGIETSCDETGVAVYDGERGLLAHALHSQGALHAPYGGVVPELASRDHIRRLLPLIRRVLKQARVKETDLNAVAFTRGPGLAGALLAAWSMRLLALLRPDADAGYDRVIQIDAPGNGDNLYGKVRLLGVR